MPLLQFCSEQPGGPTILVIMKGIDFGAESVKKSIVFENNMTFKMSSDDVNRACRN